MKDKILTKEEILKNEFIDVLVKLYPHNYTVKSEDWRAELWGKQVINRGDFKTIERTLPDFKAKLLEKNELLKKEEVLKNENLLKNEFIDVLSKVYPHNYPVKFEDWRAELWGTKVINRGDFKAIEKHLPIYKQQLLEKNKEDYFLNIYHRNTDIQQGITSQNEEAKSPGHFYLSLEANKEQKFFGKYPAKKDSVVGLIIGKAEIKTDKEEGKHKEIGNLSEETGENYIFTKSIKLSKEQYEKAFKHAVKNAELKGELYVVGFADCTDFVQSVYNAAGLPLYFTSAYSKAELMTLGTLAAGEILMKYGTRDTMQEHLSMVTGVSKEQLAATLNVDIKKIVSIAPDIDLSLQSYDSLLPKFRVAVENSDLLPLENFTKTKEDKEIKIKQLVEKTKEFMTACEQKIYNAGNKFIKSKLDEANNKGAELSAKATAEISAYNQHATAIFEQEKAKLNAELMSESKQKVANVKAMLDAKHSNHKGACDCGKTVVNNVDILAKKQQALNMLISNDAAATKKAIAEIKQKCEVMITESDKSAKTSINDAKKFIGEQKSAIVQKLKIVLEKAKEQINNNEDVDIDKFALSLKFQFSEDVDSVVQTISKFDNTTIVKAVFYIEYDNPVLNHPELMKQMANKFGFNVIDKLINFGMQFTNNAEDKAMLDHVCNESNNVDAMSLLLGLDIPENAIMM